MSVARNVNSIENQTYTKKSQFKKLKTGEAWDPVEVTSKYFPKKQPSVFTDPLYDYDGETDGEISDLDLDFSSSFDPSTEVFDDQESQPSTFDVPNSLFEKTPQEQISALETKLTEVITNHAAMVREIHNGYREKILNLTKANKAMSDSFQETRKALKSAKYNCNMARSKNVKLTREMTHIMDDLNAMIARNGQLEDILLKLYGQQFDQINNIYK